MSNIKFSQLPNLGNITPSTTIPVVSGGQNYTVTSANLQAYVNGGNGNITTGNLSATGNITASYFLGNGSQLTGLPQSYTNANVTSLLAAFGSNTISTTGNITAGNVTTGNVTANFFLGNGSQLTGIVSSYGNANVAAYLPTYTGNLGANNVITTGTDNSLGKLAVTSGVQATSSLTGAITVAGGIGVRGNVWCRGFVVGDATANVTINAISGNISTTGSIVATGNITGGNILGNGATLTNVVNTTSNQTVAGNKTFTGTTSLGPYVETTAGLVNTNSSFTPTMSNGPVQRLLANGSFTLNAPSGMTAGQSITLVIAQDGNGNDIMTPNAVYKFAYGVKTLSTTANAIDIMSIFYDGTNYLCNLVRNYS
jgi:sRNA-binding regulator protein Hfq